MKTRFLFSTAVFAVGFLCVGALQAQTFYTDRPTFQADNPGLDLEDFEGGTTPPGGLCTGPSPWDSTGGAPCFSAGDLLGGFDMNVVSGGDLVALGSGFIGGNPSTVAGPVTFADDLEINFSDPGNTAVGFDVYCLDGTGPVEVQVFGTGGLIGSQSSPCASVTGPTFWGVDAGEQITQIRIIPDDNPSNGELIDDLEFTSATQGEADPIARFAVWKDFDDNNPAEVLVTITCNTGLPLTQSKLIADNDTLPQPDGVPDGYFIGDPPVNFVVRDFEDGAMNCTITEEVPGGYEVEYFDGASFSDESCDYDGVAFGAANTCQITNTLQQVEVEVTKVWIDENPQFDSTNIAEASWFCSNVADTCDGFGCNNSGGLNFFGNPGMDSFYVYPDWDGTTTCRVTEVFLPEGGVETDDSDCQGIVVVPGDGGSCTIFNTRLYEGIPTLSHYGLAIMALVMLGIGFVGFRRFV